MGARLVAEIAVAIVNYNTREDLRACLQSAVAAGPGTIVVVDNASSDGSAALVRAEFPQVTLLANDRNGGYGRAANEAVAACTAPYVLLLNSDTLIAPDSLAALARYLDCHPRAAIAGPRLANPDGTLQASCFPFPTPLQVVLQLGNLTAIVRHLPILGKRYLRTWPHDGSRAVPWVLGAALAIRRAPFEAVGGFDESFFMYYEETDLCYRLRQAGWETHFTPATTVVHKGEQSTKQDRARMAERFFASTVTFTRQHYSPARLIALMVLLKGLLLVKLLRDRLRLPFARDDGERARLREDIGVWQRVILH